MYFHTESHQPPNPNLIFITLFRFAQLVDLLSDFKRTRGSSKNSQSLLRWIEDIWSMRNYAIVNDLQTQWRGNYQRIYPIYHRWVLNLPGSGPTSRTHDWLSILPVESCPRHHNCSKLYYWALQRHEEFRESGHQAGWLMWSSWRLSS